MPTLELTFSGDTNLLRDASTTTISLAAGTKYVIGRQPQREGHEWVQLTSSAVNFSREQFTITNDGAGWQLRSEGKKMDKIRAEWKDPPNDTIAARKRELEAEVEAEKKARPPPEKKPKRQKKGAAAPPPAAEPEAEAEEGAGMQVECLDD